MNLHWPVYIKRYCKVHVFSILYGHINVCIKRFNALSLIDFETCGS